MFNHNLIFKKDLAYNPKVQMWWLVYIEGEGQYCLICKKFDSNNPQNKKEVFSAEPSTSLKKECLEEHIAFLSAEGAGLLPPLPKAADSAPATLQFPPATFFQFENPARQSATFWDVGEQAKEDLQDDEQDYGYDEDEVEETIRSPSRRRPRPNILDDNNEEEDDQEPFNMPESSAEHSLFITQPHPEPYHEPGTLSRTQKGKTPLVALNVPWSVILLEIDKVNFKKTVCRVIAWR